MKTLLIILVVIAVITVVTLAIIGLSEKDRCPYCGSKDLEIKETQATINFARFFVKCRNCGKDFYIQ